MLVNSVMMNVHITHARGCFIHISYLGEKMVDMQ